MNFIRKAASRVNTLMLSCAVALVTSPAFASSSSSSTSSTGSLPWDTTWTTIQNDLTGPWAKGGVICAIALTGVMAAYGEHGSTFKKASGIACGGASAMSATQFATTLFGAMIS